MDHLPRNLALFLGLEFYYYEWTTLLQTWHVEKYTFYLPNDSNLLGGGFRMDSHMRTFSKRTLFRAWCRANRRIPHQNTSFWYCSREYEQRLAPCEIRSGAIHFDSEKQGSFLQKMGAGDQKALWKQYILNSDKMPWLDLQAELHRYTLVSKCHSMNYCAYESATWPDSAVSSEEVYKWLIMQTASAGYRTYLLRSW